jgi:hypothetical protein
MPGSLPKILVRIAGTVLYVKLIVRNHCIVVSFHEDEGRGHDEEEDDDP